jgi:hypothetical protein
VLLALTAALVFTILGTHPPSGEGLRDKAKADVGGGSPAQPNPLAVSQWLRASNEDLARRAEDYRVDAPRRRNELGEPEPFRERAMSAAQVNALRSAEIGQVVRLDLFPGVSREVRVIGRWEDPEETRLVASVEDAADRNRFSMSWMEGQTRGLLELPSQNLAYEIVVLEDGTYVAREWLYTDVVCARPSEEGGSADAGIPRPPEPLESTVAPAAVVPVLNSRSSAVATIYLDFDGEVVSGTAWANGATINALPARMNAAQIEETWRRVASHFSVFDVNVTTDRAVYNLAPANRKTHCVITPTKDAAPAAGGVAYLNSFTNSSSLYKVCWTFADQVPADSALVSSHEIGHTLGLDHHGRVAAGTEPREEYYRGHGTGETGWGPFMGAPYGKNLHQWSKGEYARANNSSQDDLAIMTTAARIPYLADDHGNALANATPMISGVPRQGAIERNTDGDFFRLEVGAGQQPVRLELPVGTMLDALLEVYDDQGQLLNTLNPPDLLDVNSVVNSSTRRTIFLRVAGTGKADILGTGYSDYSSLGAYTLTAGNPLPTKVERVTASPISDTSIRLTWDAAVAASSYRVLRGGVVLTNVNALAFLDSGLTEQTTYSYSVTAGNAAGDAEESDPAAGTTLTWLAANPYGLRVLTPATAVSLESGGLFSFTGQMGVGLTNGLFWSNSADRSTGFIAPASDWSQEILLAAGTNRLTFSSSYVQITGTNTTASDNPNDPAYGGGWSDGSRGGFGFGAWQLSAVGTNARHFRADNWAYTNLSVESFNGFGLQAGTGGKAWARRDLERSLAPGETFMWYFDNNRIDLGFAVGIAWADGGGTNRFGFEAVGGQANYRLSDAAGERDSGIPVTTDGLRLQFVLTGSNAYRFEAGSHVVEGQLAAGGPLSAVVASNISAGSGVERAFYLGRMSITSVEVTNRLVAAATPSVVVLSGDAELFDGLPVSWWLKYFGTIEGVSAAGDSDGDGFSNAQEYSLGTDPTDPSSRFAVSSTMRTETGVQITWPSVPGKSYQVQRKLTLGEGEWESVGGPVTAAEGETAMFADVAFHADTGFARVVLAGAGAIR